MKSILCMIFGTDVSMTAFGAAGRYDASAIQGTWLPVAATLAGNAMPDAMLKIISLELANGLYLATVAGNPDKGTYSLDATTRPRSITVTGTEGPNTGLTFPAIYQLDDDTLRICYDLSGTKRPTAFESPAGTKNFLVTYARKTN